MNSEAAVVKVGSRSKVKYLVQIAMLSAIAVILMVFDFPIPFIAPPFYRLDFSEVPVLIGAFAMGPMAGVLIEAGKVFINFLVKGTQTAGVGEFANFIIGCSFVLPASLVYKFKKTKKTAMIGLGLGVATMSFAGCLLNAYILLPMYGKLFHMPLDTFISMGAKVNPAVNSLMSFVLITVLPFNILKGVVVSIIVMLLYKRMHYLLKNNI